MVSKQDIYVKELRTSANIVYHDVEVTHNIPDYISQINPNMIKVHNDKVIEYVNKTHIVSMEMYLEAKDK